MATPPTVEIQFQLRFIESMVIVENKNTAIAIIYIYLFIYLLFVICQTLKKNYGTLQFLLTEDHMGLKISKCCSSYSFGPIHPTL